jgi:5-methylcytosine-specific restriction protein A
MIGTKKDLIRREIEEGTGAKIGLSVDASGTFSAMRIWFADLSERHGPVAELRPHGLRRHKVTLRFGSFSGAVLRQIGEASTEDTRLAQALVATIAPEVELDFGTQSRESWAVTDGAFKITAIIRHTESIEDDAAVTRTCQEVIVQIMAAMAELIGYDIVENEKEIHAEPAWEGAVLEAVVRRRERNPRNRLLCIRLHGEKCIVCGFEPRQLYGDAAGAIIEVHHLEALSLLSAPRAYDPAIDLAPLCPNCHRAVHTRRPAPIPIAELKEILEIGDG